MLAGQGANLDTTTANGRLIFDIFAALAEFERELIIERTHAGLASARARGRNGGRPFKMTAAKLRLAQAAMGSPAPRLGSYAPSWASPARHSTATWTQRGCSGSMTARVPADHVRLKRVYLPASPEDGLRVLVDRLWPRGVSKARAALEQDEIRLIPSCSADLRWIA